jgi:hypothetical protein
VKQSKNSPFKNNTNIQPTGEKSLGGNSQAFQSKHYEYTSSSKPPPHYQPPSFQRSTTNPTSVSCSYYNGIQRAQSSNYTALNVQTDAQPHYTYSSHIH